jgi:hypothetical protein
MSDIPSTAENIAAAQVTIPGVIFSGFEQQKPGLSFIYRADGNSRGANHDESGHCNVFLQLVAPKMIGLSTLDFVQRKSGSSTSR